MSILAKFLSDDSNYDPDEIQEIVDSLKSFLPYFPRPNGLEQMVVDNSALYLSKRSNKESNINSLMNNIKLNH